MNKNNILYWLSTSVVAGMSLAAAYAYFFNPTMPDMFREFGFPDWFRLELGVAKTIGALVLLIPAVPDKWKEWAYAGFVINFISAALLHYNMGAMKDVVMPLVLTVLVFVSNWFLYRR